MLRNCTWALKDIGMHFWPDIAWPMFFYFKQIFIVERSKSIEILLGGEDGKSVRVLYLGIYVLIRTCRHEKNVLTPRPL